MRTAAVTFDLDLVDHVSGGQVDEMEHAFPLFQQLCESQPDIKTTWFIRIDNQMEARFGAADYIFQAHVDKLDWLLENGHELGWHFHSYVMDNGNWKQNTDEEAVCEELIKHYAIAKKHKLNLLRMGWTYHTNRTMETINKFGLLADCSAMPRPNYTWEISTRNWEGSPTLPYYPSVADYRVPGNPCYTTVEYPLTTIPVAAPYDTEAGVLRYLNPAYQEDIFRKAVDDMNIEHCNLISHPYEYLPAVKAHGMLAFNFNSFANNLQYLQKKGYRICTLGEQINHYLTQ